MIISVDRGLSALKEKLERSGYKTVYSDEYGYSVDAHIYAGHGADSALTAGIEPQTHFYTGAFGGARSISGVIEINASEKSFGEIERELSKHRRAELF